MEKIKFTKQELEALGSDGFEMKTLKFSQQEIIYVYTAVNDMKNSFRKSCKNDKEFQKSWHYVITALKKLEDALYSGNVALEKKRT